MKSLMVTLVVFASLGTATICFANSGKKAAAKMTPQQIEKVCKEEVQSGAQKEVDRQ